MRSRVAAIAASAGLAAGVLVAGAVPASAQQTDIVVIENAGGQGKLTPGLAITNIDQTISTKGAKNHIATVSGAYAGIVGNAISISGKFTTDPDKKDLAFNGGINCSGGAVPAVWGPSGKLTVKFADISSLLKNYAAQAFVRLGASPDPVNLPDVAVIEGITTKGIFTGALVDGNLLQQPNVGTVTGDPGPVSGTNPFGASYFDTTTSAVVPGPGSLSISQNCGAGAEAITGVAFGTDGDGLLSLLGNPAAVGYDGDITYYVP